MREKEGQTDLPPLTLEQIGVPPPDELAFKQEAREWLGLEIDPIEIRRSKIVAAPNPRFSPTKAADGYPRRHELMARLTMAVALEAILNDDKIFNSPLIRKLVKLTKDAPFPTILQLGKEFLKYQQHWEQSEQNIEKTIRPTQSLRDIFNKLDNFISNYLHDNQHFTFFHLLGGVFSNIEIYHRKNPGKPCPYINDLLGRLPTADTLMMLRSVTRSYQQEILPGWAEEGCQVRNVLSTYGMIVARAYNYTLVVDGDIFFENEMGVADGKIEITVDQSVPPQISVTAGAILRIISNVIINSILACDKARRINSGQNFPPPNLRIGARKIDGSFCLTIEDNGPGFDSKVALKAIKELCSRDPSYLETIKGEIPPDIFERVKRHVTSRWGIFASSSPPEGFLELFFLRGVSKKMYNEQNPGGRYGLGLSSLKRLITTVHRKGNISLNNRPEGGAIVTVTIPFS